MRHLVAESTYPHKVNTNKTDDVVGGTPRHHDGRAGSTVFYSNLLSLVVLLPGSMAATEWAPSAQPPNNISFPEKGALFWRPLFSGFR